ncbi:MAG: hypothetical protein RLZZ458_417 [Planctomycetota bacterium]
MSVSALFLFCCGLCLQDSAAATGAATAPAQDPAASSSTVEETATLRYQFTPGQQLRYRSEQKMTLEAQVGQDRRVDVSEVRQTRLFTVASVNDAGTAELAMQFEHVWMRKQVDNGQPLDFDSNMKPSEVPETFRGVAHSLRGNAPRFHLTNLGTTATKPQLETAGGVTRPSLPSPVEQDPASQANSSQPPAIQQASGSKADADRGPGTFLMLLPDQPVRVGDTWKEEIPLTVRAGVDSTLQVNVLRTYRLDRLTGDTAHVSFRSSLRSPTRSTVIRSQLIQATPSGSFIFDRRRGVMLSREFRYSETVIGALGAESLLSSIGTQTESLVEAQNP